MAQAACSDFSWRRGTLVVAMVWLCACSGSSSTGNADMGAAATGQPPQTAGNGSMPVTAGTAGVSIAKAGSGATSSAGRAAVTGGAGATTTSPTTTSGAGGATTTTGAAGTSSAGTGGGAGVSGATAAAVSGSGGMAASAGSSGSAGTGADTGDCKAWPAANGSQTVSATIKVSGHMDGQLKRYVGSGALGSGNQDEGQDPLFELADGATLENVVIGAPAADGIHCKGTCTLRNVWWEDVGEDAATFEGTGDSQTMTVECSGAKKADDKVLQHNGPGTMIVKQFFVEDFGKLYRSCGNCKTQHERHVELSDIDAKQGKAALAGINVNYNDTAKLMNITVHDTAMKLDICDKYTGNSTGAEPTKTSSGPDAKNCLYSASDISWQP